MDPVTISKLSSDNRLAIEYTLLKKNLLGFKPPWERVLAGSYSLAIGLYSSARVELTFTDVFADLDATTKAGTLLLDTAAVNAAFTGPPAVTQLTGCIFEIRITDSAGNKHTFYREENVTFDKPLITPASLSVAAGEVGASQGWVINTCMPKDGTNAATPLREFFMKSSPSGFQIRVWADDDGVLQSEKF